MSAVTLTQWQHAVDELSHLAGHTDAPRVQWCASSGSTRYTRRTDTIGVDRRFARRWRPTSPEARWLLAHELGHRSHPDTATDARRAALWSRPALTVTVLGSLIGAAAVLVQVRATKPGAIHLVLAATTGIFSAFAVVVATIGVLHHVITKRTRAELFAAEFAADDYATALQGADGCRVVAQLPGGGLLMRLSPRTHPPDDERVARQRP